LHQFVLVTFPNPTIAEVTQLPFRKSYEVKLLLNLKLIVLLLKLVCLHQLVLSTFDNPAPRLYRFPKWFL
jgi:hypothetical protein